MIVDKSTIIYYWQRFCVVLIKSIAHIFLFTWSNYGTNNFWCGNKIKFYYYLYNQKSNKLPPDTLLTKTFRNGWNLLKDYTLTVFGYKNIDSFWISFFKHFIYFNIIWQRVAQCYTLWVVALLTMCHIKLVYMYIFILNK